MALRHWSQFTRFVALSALAGVGAVTSFVSAARAAAPAPWDTPFSADAKALLAAAQRLPAPPDGTEVDLLFDEHHVRYDADGKRTTVHRLVFRPLTAASAKDWALYSINWEPWHEAEPVVRARVIELDGTVHELDPKTFSDQPARDHDSDQLTDARELRGPLPAMSPGVLVEEQVTLRETAPTFRSGDVDVQSLAHASPTRRVEFSVEVAPNKPLTVRLFGLPASSETHEGKTRVRISAVNVPAQSEPEANAPGEVSWPHVRWSTSPSWSAAAKDYAAVVEAQLAQVDAATLPPLPPPMSPATTGAPTRLAVARQRLAQLHALVRYTGVEFGEAAVVPRAPREVLARGYGDCKDLSTLLVAMLRAAGQPAQVVLLNASGATVRAELPGLGSFDHAIVVIPAQGQEPAVWIDPSSSDTPAGRLPAVDGGRLALVASAQTTALEHTPESAGNRSLESREVTLSEWGGSQATLELQSQGALDEWRRSALADKNAAAIRDNYQKFAESIFDGGTVDSVDVAHLDDVDQPVHVTVKMSQSAGARTGLNDAFVRIDLGTILGSVPPALYDPDDKNQPARTQPLRLLSPYVAELNERIIVPPTFAARDLPASRVTPLGAGSLTEEYEMVGGVVTVRLVLDLSAPLWTAAQVNALREGVRKLTLSEPLLIHFDTLGALAQADGHLREALEQFRLLVSMHPDEAIHHAQLAYALLAAGAGDEARQEAREATRLEPNSALAFRTLGYALQHDALGRFRRPGMDLAGAMAAEQRARKLEPDNVLCRRYIAQLYQYAPDGERFGKGAQLDKAAAEYRALHDELHADEADDELLLVLVRLGRSDEALQRGATMKRSPDRDALLAAAAALHGGAPAAELELSRLGGEAAARRDALELAGRYLLQMRQYASGADLLARAADGAAKPAELLAQAERFRGVKPVDAVSVDNDPASVVRRLIYHTVDGSDVKRAVWPLFAQRIATSLTATQLEQAFGAARTAIRANGMPSRTLMIDLVGSMLTIDTSGNAKAGWRAVGRFPSGRDVSSQTMFLVPEQGKARLLCTADARCLPELAQQSLIALGSGDAAGARQWLDWVNEIVRPDSELGTCLGDALPTGKSADASHLQLAVAAIRSDGASVPLLRAARDRAPAGPLRYAYDVRLIRALTAAQHWDEALAEATALQKEVPFAEPFELQREVLLAAHRRAELRRFDEAWTRARPNDPLAWADLQSDALADGDWDASSRAGLHALELRDVDRGLVNNNLAWLAYVSGHADADALQRARLAVEAKNSASRRNTLATLYVALGRVAEARQQIASEIENEDQNDLRAEDWFVVGLLAEADGLPRTALAAYAHVPVEKDPAADSISLLVQRRVAALRNPNP